MLGTDQPLHPIRPNVPFDDRKLHIHTWALHTTALPLVLFHARQPPQVYFSLSPLEVAVPAYYDQHPGM